MPMTTTTPGPVVRHLVDAPSVPCPCGTSTRPLTELDGAPYSVHVTQIRDSVRHYHRDTAEVYYILEGVGKIELDGEWHDIRPSTTIHIPPGVRHKLVSEAGVKTVIVAVPPYSPRDEYLD
jgi:mannose-6-phosphate isomerase-like protein (cupin superfamily)